MAGGNVEVGVILAGEVQVRTERGEAHVVGAGCWYLLADLKGASGREATAETRGVLLHYPLALHDALAHGPGEVPATLSCLTCPSRTQAYVATGLAAGRIAELAEGLLAEGGVRLLRTSLGCELLARVFEQPELSTCVHCDSVGREQERRALEAVAQFLQENLSEEHSLAELSRRHHLNEFKLKRGFREQYGSTVFGYLRRKRMERARELLLGGDESVLGVANAVGYANPSHFTRAFRSVHGINPGTLLQRRAALTSQAAG